MDRRKNVKKYIVSALTGWIIKLLADIVMYLFMIGERGDDYNSFFGIIIPQAAATVLMLLYYIMYFRREFFGYVFKISAVVLIVANIGYMAFLYFFDMPRDFTYYFSATALLGFFSAFFLKCNIMPVAKPGQSEIVPIMFELVVFVCMVMSAMSVFFGFYFENGYHDIQLSFKMNIASEIILSLLYIVCLRNKCEIVRDNMFSEDEIV